jgi:hypothetical protein
MSAQDVVSDDAEGLVLAAQALTWGKFTWYEDDRYPRRHRESQRDVHR